MVYSQSQSLLSRKGPLGAVLVAAYCHTRLKKARVIATDIPFSVRKILDEGFSAFTYRILGYLLLGVVRIYSHKVEYVLLDCNRLLLNAKQVAVKGKEPQESSFLGPNRSITLPMNLDLDKFIFEDMEAERIDHVLPEEEIMLKDSWGEVQALKYSPIELPIGGVSIHLETFSDSPSPDYNILSPHLMDMSLDDNLVSDDMHIERTITTLVQKLSLPVEACEAEMVNLPVLSSSFPAMTEVLNDDNETQNSNHTEAESSQGQRGKAAKLSLTVERSPEMKFSEHTDGDQAAEFQVFPTPTNIENVPVMRKTKLLFDEQIILDNKIFKENLAYSRDLLHKRGRVPHTTLSVWKHGLVSNMKKNLMRPLIHCAFMDSNFFHFDDKIIPEKISPNSEASIALEISVPTKDMNTDYEKELVYGPMASVADAVNEHVPIAPETPHRNVMAKGFMPGDIIEKVREVSLSSILEEELSVEHHEELLNEDNISVSSEADFEEPDGWSTSTRQAIQDLSSAFYAINGQELEQVNLQNTLKGASKNKSAKLFYDILVLKNRCMINVQQHKPYGDILVTKSTGWENQ